MAPEPLDLEMLLRIPRVDATGGLALAPDGAQAAFSWNRSGRWEIYEILLDNPSRPWQISRGPGGKFAPHYSPDGRYLAYVMDMDGGENYDIYCFDRRTDLQANLTPVTPEALQPNLSWSPDGRQIAFLSDRSGNFKAYTMPLSGEPGQLVLDLPYPAWEARWSPDGRWLAVTVEARGQDYYTYLVPMEAGVSRPESEARLIAEDGAALNARQVRWSPKGDLLAFASDAPGRYEIGLNAVGTGELTWLTSGEGDKHFPTWSPDGERLAFILSKGPQTWLAVQTIRERSPTLFQVKPGVHHAPRFTAQGDGLVFIFESPSRPPDLWRLSFKDETFEQLTDSRPADLEERAFTHPVEVRYPGLDGVPVPALLFKPRNAKELPPAVVVIHGGPNWHFSFAWEPLMQHMAGRGWIVLAPNYRGSTGYGREWQLASRFDLGGVDTADVVAGADYLVAAGLADPRHLAVTGRSHGGYLTMSALTQFPERWAAGSAVVPFLNWFTAHANSREDLQHWDLENFGDPQEHEALWRARSPYFFLDQMRAPVQLIGGANDPRCPASEACAAHAALKALGKEVDLRLYPDEGHSFLKLENLIEAETRRVAFLARHLA